MSYSRIISTSEQSQLLEPDQLSRLEQAFRQWTAKAGKGRALSRNRILVVFLLIRYTGAKLNEVLSLDAKRDIKLEERLVYYGGGESEAEDRREIQISRELAESINGFLKLAADSPHEEKDIEREKKTDLQRPFAIDPAYVRRQFYERGKDCGLDPKRSGPEMIRKARGLELMRNNVPLPVVQRLLGHSSPNLTASHVTFSEEDMRQVARWFVEKESGRKTSARNAFFGKVNSLARGDVQSLVEIVTPEGFHVSTMITNSSAERLGLKPGRLASAEIKAPWLILEDAGRPGRSSADNTCEGVIAKVYMGAVNVECEVRIHEKLKLCAILSTPGFQALGLGIGDKVRVLFSCYAVILHVD